LISSNLIQASALVDDLQRGNRVRKCAVATRPLDLDNGSVYIYYKPELLALPALPAFLSFY
jgi:hypothetical protein